jgi:hypothetical protein
MKNPTWTAMFVFLILKATPIIAGEASCIHGQGEDTAQKARRTAAIRLVRAVNTAEANGTWRDTKQYQCLTELMIDLKTAPGFEPHFTKDRRGYALILVDETDPCGFAASTNENGVIFQGYPIDYDVQLVKGSRSDRTT